MTNTRSPRSMPSLGAALLSVTVALMPGATAAAQSAATPVVGPPHGAVMVVGGGALGPEVYAKFIELAGGPDALIVDVPTAGGDSVYPPNWSGANGFKQAGAKNVVILHTIDRAVANTDSFVAPLKKAGGVWFEGGRQWHLVDSYAGTKTEVEFHNVLARGGVAGGSSAGASILASFLLRGAREGNDVMIAPAYTKGFGFLTGVGIDQHVVARSRLADIADSVMPRHPELLGMSEDEGTVWVVRGDIAQIIGRDKAFVYGGKDPTDSGKPFLTLHPGDQYNLGTRHVVHRVAEESPVSERYVDSLFADFAKGKGMQATVLVAENGKVFIDKSYGVPPQPKYMPTTTLPNFPLAGLSNALNGLAAALLVEDGRVKLDDPLTPGGTVTVAQYFGDPTAVANGGKLFLDLVTRTAPAPAAAGRGGRGGGARANAAYTALLNRVYTPVGLHQTAADSAGQFKSDVDELYRLDLGLQSPSMFVRDSLSTTPGTDGQPKLDASLGWHVDKYLGAPRLSLYGTSTGKQNAFVRLPSRNATIIILTNADEADVESIARRITDRLLGAKPVAKPVAKPGK